jgi:hypothetical protein
MYDDYYYGSSAGLLAAYAGIFVFGLIVFVAIYVLSAIFLKKIFEKAGVANPNVAWIPVYNYLLFIKLGDVNPFLYLIAIGASVLLGSIPVIGQIVGLASLAIFVAASYRINLKLQKDPVPFTIFAALLSIIWLGVIAFGKEQWNTASRPLAGVAPVPAPQWAHIAFFMDQTTWGGVPHQGYVVTPKPAGPAAPPAAPPAA